MTGSSVGGLTAEPVWVGEVLDFWFRELTREQWFRRDDQVDQTIRARFSALHDSLAGQDLPPRAATARHALAAVIVLDQFPRNMFRGTPRAFATDTQARAVAQAALEAGLDTPLTTCERLFLYLPLEHSEDPEDQRLAVALISALGDPELTRYAIAHQTIIDRFGRFPHRNAILGRPSTPEEIAFLKEPDSAF
ncbi:MAG TPA: DUF924 family protein [Hyphomicrobiaceae bacterium]|nr:DUF924 family protein [Hyphomicrobiaceae bacterium]